MTALLKPAGSKVPPTLTGVPRKKAKAAFAPFVVVLALVLGAGMVGQLALSTALEAQSFAIDDLRQQSTDLDNQLSDLQAKVAVASSTTSLASQATKLGMKPNPYPIQLALPDGKVVGKPTVVTGDEVTSDAYRTPGQLSRQRTSADAAAKKAADAAAAKKAAAAAAKKADAKKTADAAAGTDAKKPANAPKKGNPR